MARPRREVAIASRHRSDGVAEHSDIRIALKDWRVFGIGFVGIGVIFCITGVQLWVPQIVQAMGFPNETVGVVVALPFVCAIAAIILWGYASDSRKERIWHIASAALFTALGLIIASISTSHLLVLLGLTIAIVGQFSALPVINTLLPSLLRGPALAGGIAVYNTMAQFGGFLSDCDWRSQTGDEQLCGRPYCVGGSRDLVGGGHSSPRPRAFAARRVRKHRPRIAKPCDRATEGSR